MAAAEGSVVKWWRSYRVEAQVGSYSDLLRGPTSTRGEKWLMALIFALCVGAIIIVWPMTS